VGERSRKLRPLGERVLALAGFSFNILRDNIQAVGRGIPGNSFSLRLYA
jgi:hypothetical protein